MNPDFVYSDEDCCNKCRCMYYDMTRGNYCERHNKPVQPYNPACADMDRILQGFGE